MFSLPHGWIAELFANLPPWATWLISALIVAFVAASLFTIWRSLKGAVGLFESLTALQKQNAELSAQAQNLLRQYQATATLAQQGSDLAWALAMQLHALSQLIEDIMHGHQTDSAGIEKSLATLPHHIAESLRSSPFDPHRVALWVRDDQNPDLLRILYGSSGFTQDQLEHRRLRIDHSAAGHTFRTGESYFCGEVQQDSTFDKTGMSREIHSLICVPVRLGNTIHGVLSVDSVHRNAFTPYHLQLVELFGLVAGLLLSLR